MQPRRSRKGNPAAGNRALTPISLKLDAGLRQVLVEVRELLESYAPAWCSEALSKKSKPYWRQRQSDSNLAHSIWGQRSAIDDRILATSRLIIRMAVRQSDGVVASNSTTQSAQMAPSSESATAFAVAL